MLLSGEVISVATEMRRSQFGHSTTATKSPAPTPSQQFFCGRHPAPSAAPLCSPDHQRKAQANGNVHLGRGHWQFLGIRGPKLCYSMSFPDLFKLREAN